MMDNQEYDTRLKNEQRKKARIVTTVHPSPASLKRRADLETDIMRWFPYYFPNVFFKPFGKMHFRAGRKLQACIESGGRFAFSMPRASGKSSFGKPAMPYCALTGKSKFPVALGASTKLTQSYHDFVKIAMMGNPQLQEDYPEFCCFFTACEGKAIKAHNQLFEDGKKTGLKLKDDHIGFPMVADPEGKPYAGAGSTIFFRSMDSRIRGITETMQDGTIIRPSIVFPDDVQDDIIARSDTQSAQLETKMTSTVLGLAGPFTKLACFMPGTVQRKGDFFSMFLDRKKHPDFQGENVPMIIKWPDALKTLWMEYETMWREDQENDKGLDGCFKFLKDNWDAMHAGSELSWDERIAEGELSALQTAMHIYFEVGATSFFSEYQGEPIDIANSQYVITVDTILEHVADLQKFELPIGSDVVVGHTDINRAGLHWCIGGFTQNMTCHVPLYGKTPSRGDLWEENASQQDKERGIFNGLKSLCDSLEQVSFNCAGNGSFNKISLLLIDRGYEHTIVDSFCDQARYSFRVMPDFGQTADKYRPTQAKAIGRIMDNCYYGKFQTGKAVSHNSDFWRETVQRSFLTDCGNAGGTTIYKGISIKEHNKFAEHLTGERLVNKWDDKYGLHYEWQKANKKVNVDWLDALVGCWVAAAMSGLSPAGMAIQRKARPKARRRRVHHIKV